MQTPSMIFILAMVTLAAGLVYGVWQIRRVREAKRTDADTALERPGDA